MEKNILKSTKKTHHISWKSILRARECQKRGADGMSPLTRIKSKRSLIQQNMCLWKPLQSHNTTGEFFGLHKGSYEIIEIHTTKIYKLKAISTDGMRGTFHIDLLEFWIKKIIEKSLANCENFGKNKFYLGHVHQLEFENQKLSNNEPWLLKAGRGT